MIKPDGEATQPQVTGHKRRDYGRGFANLVAVIVGVDAGYLSWRHLNELGNNVLQDPVSAALSPFAIDGMIIVGTLQLRAARRQGHPAHWAAYLCLIIGVVLTVAGNIASAPPQLWARVLSAAPPIAFLLSVETLFGKTMTQTAWQWIRSRRRSRPQPDSKPGTAAPADKPVQTAATPPAAPTPAATPRPVVSAVPAPVKRPETPPQTERAGGRKPNVPVAQPVARTVRIVDGAELAGDALRAHGMGRALAALRAGDRISGQTLAESYDPPMGRRWGVDRLNEARQVFGPRAAEQGQEPADEPEEKKLAESLAQPVAGE